MTVLNARLVFENEYISFVTYDDEHHRVAFVQIPGLEEGAGRQLGPRPCRLHLRRSRPAAVDLSPAQGRGHRAGAHHQPRPDRVDVLQGSRRQPGRAAGRRLRQGGRRRLLRHRAVRARIRSACCSTPTRWLADYEAGVPEADLLRRPADDSDERSRSLSQPGRELDGGAHRAARDRRAVRHQVAVLPQEGAPAAARSSRSIPPARCRPCWSTARRSPRSRAACSISPSAFPRRGCCRRRSARRGAGGVVDVVHRLDPASGAPPGRGRMSPRSGRWPSANSATATGCSAVLDRRHPFVSFVLAHGQCAAAAAARTAQSRCALRAHDGASCGAAHDRDREHGIGYELPA